MSEVDFKTIAADAIDRGFAVIPLIAGKKDPDFTLVPRINGEVGTGGAARRTRSMKTIEMWAQVSPNANIGVCSDDTVTILESDDEAQFRQLVRNVSRQMFGEPRELPVTLTAQARANRPHFFFLATPKTRKVEGAPGIQGLFEWRRENQYVVGVGSLHPTGVHYRYINDRPMVEMPDWLVDVLLEIRQAYRGENSRVSNYVRVGPAAIARDKLLNEYALDPRLMLEDADFELHVPAGERHYFLQAMAGLLHDGERDEDELFELLTAMRDRYCEEGKGDYEITNLVQWTMRQKPCTLEPNLPIYVKGGVIYKTKDLMDAAPDPVDDDAADLITPRYAPVLGKRDEFEFVMEPLPNSEFNGWFPRGTVSLVAGSSGSGKSTFMLDMLHKQASKQYILGHRGAGLRYLVLFADRGDLSNRMTLKRMGLHPNDVNIDYLGTVLDMDAVQSIWNAVEKFEEHELPQAVFVEGMDLMVSEMNKMHIVGPVMRGLQRLATHYHIAVVLSLGAPKQNQNNKGTAARRDMVIGSSGWGRTAETVCVLTAEGDGTSGRRKFTAQHRNAATETFEMDFQNGLLVEAPPEQTGDPLDQWLLTQPLSFTLTEAVEGVKEADMKESRTTIYRRLEKLIKDGKMETVFTDRKQRYQVKKEVSQ